MADTLVAIITYNRKNSLQTLLTQINKDREDFDLIVIDDCSTDGTQNFLYKEFETYNIDWYQTFRENCGVSVAKNAAIRRGHVGKYGYTFILEDDVRIKKSGWVELYKKAMDTTPIKHFNFLPPITLPKGVYPPPLPESPYPYGKILSSSEHDGFNIDYWSDLGGTFMALTKDVVLAVGGFNSRFSGRGFNHVEYSYRIARLDYTTHPPIFGGDAGWAHVRESTNYINVDWLQKPSHTDFENPEENQRRLAYNWQVFQNTIKSKDSQLYNASFLRGQVFNKKITSACEGKFNEQELSKISDSNREGTPE